MDRVHEFQSLHLAGVALLVTAVMFMIRAFSAAYFRPWPLPGTPLVGLKFASVWQ